MLTLTASVDARAAFGALARLDLAAVRWTRTIPADALAHEAGLLSAASPVRTGRLASSYVVQTRFTGAVLTNAAPYFAFNLFGTGRRGAAAGVPGSLFGTGGWRYGPRPGMAPYAPLLAAWRAAPDDIARYAEARLTALF